MKTKSKTETKETTEKRAILYARMAVKDLSQKPNRIQLQLDELSVYCQDHNIQVEKMLADYSHGNSFDRRDFKELLRDLRQGKIKADLLLFTTWDRFSRDLNAMKKMVKELESLGIKPQAIKDKTGSRAILNILKRLQ